MPTAAQPPKTYVLVGDDPSGTTFSALKEIYKDDPNCVVIEAHGQDIKQAVENIKGPANIVLAAHGSEDGSFIWNSGESVKYDKLFAALPREGIESVTIDSCYGGSAEKTAILKAAPEGTVVQSLVGANNVGHSGFITDFAKASHKGGSSTDLLVESLAVFDPDKYRSDATNWNNEKKYGVLNTDPEKALPHLLGIGGLPPVDLDTKINNLEATGVPANKAAAWSDAIKQTHTKFEHAVQSGARRNYDKGEIELVAHKMQTGEKINGAEEKRVAYALMAEYMDKSGDLAHDIAVAKNHGREPAPPPQREQPQPDVTAPPPPPKHTEHTAVEPRAQLPKMEKAESPKIEPKETQLQPQGMPDLSALKADVLDRHRLVTATHQNGAETKALEEFAKVMHVQGVSTDAPKLSIEEIKKIQAALHVKQDGLIGEKTMHAMMHAEEVRALPTPGNGAPAHSKAQAH